VDILGLNNANFLPQPKAEGQKSNQEKSANSTSFESALKAQTSTKQQPAAKTQFKSKTQLPAKNEQVQTDKNTATNTVSDTDADSASDTVSDSATNTVSVSNRESARTSDVTIQDNAGPNPTKLRATAMQPLDLLSIDQNLLPVQPTPPAFSGAVDDRWSTGPVTAELLNPVGKNAAVAGEETSVDGLTRRAVWHDFLRKMKDDLDIGADELLEAFSSLSDEELSAPPQYSVDKIVMALGLVGNDAEVARKHFMNLVNKTKSGSMGEELASSQRQINLTLMSQREMQRKNDLKSIDRISNGFMASQAKPVKERALDGLSAPQQQPLEETSNFEKSELSATALKQPAREMVQVQGPKGSEILESAPMTKPVQEKNTVDELVRQFMLPQSVPQKAAVEVAPLAEPAAKAIATANTPVVPMTGPTLPGLGNLADSDSEDDGEFTSDASYLAPTGLQDGKHLGGATIGSDFQAELSKLSPQQPISVNELVDRAQVMVTDGGGEMKVTLTPEGLGEVAMRVSVEDGKVSVQMITESDEAKKMIERQLSELKSQLSNNHLQVDTIKIDTATNLGKQLEQQYSDAQRQLAQQTLEQFRQDHQGWRRSFFEVPGAKQYRGQGEALRDSTPPSSSRSRANRRLDLVA
jgi:flagellar hook-length control protein FliK